MTTDPEIERLREELAIEKGWVSQYRDSYCKQVAEIERLQNANQDLVDERDIFKRTLDKRDAEIERLRTALVADDEGRVAYQNGFHARDAEIERLRKELEREKEEHDRCTTFHAIAVKERNYERVLALHRDTEIKRLREENSTFSDSLAAKADRIDRLGETVARQVAEIERLRGLLEDACRWHEQFPIQRVRELLGER